MAVFAKSKGLTVNFFDREPRMGRFRGRRAIGRRRVGGWSLPGRDGRAARVGVPSLQHSNPLTNLLRDVSDHVADLRGLDRAVQGDPKAADTAPQQAWTSAVSS